MNPQSQAEAPSPLPPLDRLQALLFEAARLGRDDMIAPLLQAGADLEAHNAKGHTALILASYNGNASTTALLLEQGAAVDAPDTGRGNTALMGVAFKGYESIVRHLVEAGADVDRRNNEGQTALMNATIFGHAAIVEYLLGNGADPMAVDAGGNSPASLAASQSNVAMSERIQSAIRAALPPLCEHAGGKP